MSGHLELDATPLEQVGRDRGWTPQQVHNAKRIIDGGLGSNYGFKEYEEVKFGSSEGSLEGYGWVYHLYDERVTDLESIL